MLRALRDHYLRIDARSLGLFRVLFALVLIGDLLRRWYWLKEFYTNEGVLPNHNHLFNLKDNTRVWSVLHAFSTPGENHFAFAVFLVVYVLFLVGYKTRVFHALSLVALVSLSQRNILLENAGNYAAVALLAFTLLLPCGRRFSLDALLGSLAARHEKTAAELNDRKGRAWSPGPGESPTSMAALAILVQIALICVCTALQQKGAPWRDGSALHYALHVDRWVGDIGVAARGAPSGLLRVWTFGLYAAEVAVPILIFVPILRRFARGAAAALLAFYGLSFGLLFDFGLWGWTMLAAAALLLNGEWWDAAARKRSRPDRVRTVIYDTDCGVCLLICRVVKRLDALELLRFRGNDELAPPGEAGAEEQAPRSVPAAVTAELVQTTVVVVDPSGAFFTRGRAAAEIVGVLPLGRPISWFLRVPGISHLLDLFYDAVAVRRFRLSELLGYGTCGLPMSPEQRADHAAEMAGSPPPAARLAAFLRGSVREGIALIVFAAMLVQTARVNPLPVAIPEIKALEPVALWPRMMARWDMLAPEPPTTDGLMVIDAQTKGSKSVDPLTGLEPDFQLVTRPVRPGQLWSDYLDRIHDKEHWGAYEKAFKDYIVKGGPVIDVKIAENAISGLDAYWVTQASPLPGQREVSEPAEKAKIFTHSRGGRLGADRPPSLRTDRKLMK